MSALVDIKILLIVEDQILPAMGLKDELEDGGYRVLELAVRHQEALGLAREIKPDLALVNIELACGDDGGALAHDLKGLGVPVLFISGQVDRAKLGRAVAIASLAKPYSGADIVDAVDYLFRHEHGDESRPGPAAWRCATSRRRIGRRPWAEAVGAMDGSTWSEAADLQKEGDGDQPNLHCPGFAQA